MIHCSIPELLDFFAHRPADYAIAVQLGDLRQLQKAYDEGETRPVAWLLTNDDGGQRIVFGRDPGTPMADETATPILLAEERSFTVVTHGAPCPA